MRIEYRRGEAAAVGLAEARRSALIHLPVQFGSNWTSLMGAVEGVLRASGDERDTDELMGLSGFAFRLAARPDVSPDSVNALHWAVDIPAALARLGYSCEVLYAGPDDPLRQFRLTVAHSRIVEQLAAGRPVVAWRIGMPEFGVIHGVDLAEGTYAVSTALGERGPSTIPLARLGSGEVPVLCVIFLGERYPLSEEEVARAALRFAVRHANGKDPDLKSFDTGLAAYETWIASLREGTADPFGNAYCAQVFAHARGCAARFLSRLAGKGWRNAQTLALAAGRYSKVTECLEEFTELFSFPPDPAALASASNRQKGASLLRSALYYERVAVATL
ncbi:MAG: hypothetical protein HY335_01665 [Deinococcus sp.]|nr:hypothetical protein [Deinococcus sp.]